MSSRDRSKSSGSAGRDAFTPQLVTALREGYDFPRLRADAVAGLTVAIVALPLSMAIAIASGLSPERGLYAAIVGGFIVSLLGGSRHQIGGPAGAFIVIVAAIVQRHGIDGFLLATMLAGLILTAVGFLRLGAYIRFIPHPVTIGFTAGIAVIIFASQLRDFFGLALPASEPGPIIPKIQMLAGAYQSVSAAALALGAASIAVIALLKRLRPGAPGMLVAVVGAAVAAAAFGLDVETIGSRFGGIPGALPTPALPEITLARIVDVLPDAFALALLGGIESLLSAVVADGMSGRRHRSNMELVAQGVANVATALFGGVTVTGTIARTATNIRSGAATPVAGMLHAVFLLGFMLLAAPLASFVPLAALAGVLIVVAWNMAERREFISLLKRSRAEAAVLLATFLLTVFVDLMTGIAVGVVLGALVFMHRMADIVSVFEAPRASLSDAEAAADDVMVYRVSGPLFFGASSTIAATLERIGAFPRVVVVDLAAASMADASAAGSFSVFVGKAVANGATVYFAGASPAIRRALARGGLRPPRVRYAPDVETARALDRAALSR